MKTFKKISQMVGAAVLFVALSSTVFAQKAHYPTDEMLDMESLEASEADMVPGIFAFTPDLVEPEATNYAEVCQEIGYPEVAQEAQLEGTVQTRILVDASGQYMHHVVTKSTHQALSEAVESKIASLTFEPAQLHGDAVPAWVSLSFKFRILP